MNILKTLIIAAFILGSTACLAQSTLKGRVIDLQTREPVNFVSITDPRGKLLGTTGDDGEFSIETTGRTQIFFRRAGYRPTAADIRTIVDYLVVQLQPGVIYTEEVNVTGFNTDKDLLLSPGSIGLLTERDFDRTNEAKLSDALNMVPGVRMEMKNSLSTSRIIIRGVGARSNFDTRTVKIYLNDISLTDASGYSSLNGIDVAILDRVEILKGPASSIYGANIAGVLNIETERAAFNDKELKAFGLGGSYGLNKFGTSFKTGSNNSSIFISYNHQEYEGYREHSRDTKNFVTLMADIFPNKDHIISIFGNYSMNDFFIPGSLDSLQILNNPRQADTNYVKKLAGYRSDDFRGGVSSIYSFNDKIENTTSIFASSVEDDNPLTYAYIESSDVAYGIRTKFDLKTEIGKKDITFIGGGEFIINNKDQRNYENLAGEKGEITSNKNYILSQLNLFTQSNLSITDEIFLTLGAGLNKTKFEIDDILKANGVDETGTKEFELTLSPRAALIYNIGTSFKVHSSVSFGFSPPAISEVYMTDGSINNDIQPEKAINYEAGIRGIILDELFYDAVFFSMNLTGELIPRSVGPNQFMFVNSGETRHNGLELSLTYTKKLSRGLITAVNLYTAYSFNDFKFTDYDVNGVNYSGNQLTGTAKHYFNAGLDLYSDFGGYLFVTYNFTDKIPILDDNSVFSKPYSLLNAKAGVKFPLFGKVMLDVSAGADNILDESYSSFLMLNQQNVNGAPPKYYNPSPGRSLYGRVGIMYSL